MHLEVKAKTEIEVFYIFKAKIHFWYLHFEPILVLVSTFLECLCWSLKIKNLYYFGPYRHLSNRHYLRDR